MGVCARNCATGRRASRRPASVGSTRRRGAAPGARPPASRLHPGPRPRGRRGARGRPGAGAGGVGHDHPAGPGAAPRAGPAGEGPRRRDDAALRAPCSSPASAPRSPSSRRPRRLIADAAAALVSPGSGDRDLGGHHDLRRRSAAAGRAPTDRGHQLGAGRGRAVPRRTAGPDGHPHGRRADARRTRWPVRSRSRRCARSTSTWCSWVSTAWTRAPASRRPTCWRPRPTGHSWRPAGGWSSSPTTPSGASSG